MQPELSLIYREEEREMLPLCRDQGVGVIPWSPLGRGRLARPWGEHTPRIASDAFGATLFAHTEDNDRRVAEALASVAAQRGVPRAQVALAWLLQTAGRHRADRRRVEAGSTRRCRRRTVADAAAGRDGSPASAVSAAPGRRLRLKLDGRNRLPWHAPDLQVAPHRFSYSSQQNQLLGG